MSKEQQSKQIVTFIPGPPPFSKVVPTKGQIESWKNSKLYGVWINDKRVSNTELNNYQNSDFAHVFVSKLGKNCINYGKHYYQIDLMTINHYENYYKQLMSNKKKYYLTIRVVNKN